jgi:hypothetical protein
MHPIRGFSISVHCLAGGRVSGLSYPSTITLSTMLLLSLQMHTTVSVAEYGEDRSQLTGVHLAVG